MISSVRLLALLVGLASLTTAAGASTPSVWVTIPPQRWVVQRLAGQRVTADVLVPAGQSLETYEPSPKQIAGIASADLLIRLGVPFEDQLVAPVVAVAPRLVVVDGSRGISLAPMSAPAVAIGHDHDHGGGQPDPHYWLDPTLLAVHAATVCEALCRLLPADSPELRRNLESLRRDLEATDARVATRLAPLAGQAVLVYHPAFGYFTRRYHLEQVAVEVEGKEPTARQLAGLVDLARRFGIHAMFVQPQFSGRSPRALADAVGASLVVLDPLAEDYLTNLESMAEQIASAHGR